MPAAAGRSSEYDRNAHRVRSIEQYAQGAAFEKIIVVENQEPREHSRVDAMVLGHRPLGPLFEPNEPKTVISGPIRSARQRKFAAVVHDDALAGNVLR
jgi:hypothetical protein